MVINSSIDILNVKVLKLDYLTLLNKIKSALHQQEQLTVTGANVNFINISKADKLSSDIFSKIDIIHPDGIGIFLASKFLYGRNGFRSRFTGSDFYHILINAALKERWSFFFFGDKDDTPKKISSVHPDMIITGYQNGFTYENDKVIDRINKLKPDILVVGMGSPKQEEWIISSKKKLNVKIIIATGDGIKVFSGTKKRGPKLLRKIGLEWAVRLFFEPKRLWRRYLVGNPLFLIRIIKCKFSKKYN